MYLFSISEVKVEHSIFLEGILNKLPDMFRVAEFVAAFKYPL